MGGWDADPLVVRIVTALCSEKCELTDKNTLDLLVAGLCITASENKWYQIVQLCLPALAEARESVADFTEIDDSELGQLLVSGHRINDALHLKLHGRDEISGQLQGIQRPARILNLPLTDRWVSTDTIRSMLADIAARARSMPLAKRHRWAGRAVFKQCASLNARMLSAIDFQLIRHQMATGLQWVRLCKTSENEAVHVRIHYASGILSVAIRVGGFARSVRTILPLVVGKLLADEERIRIDRGFAITFLSGAVFRSLDLLRRQGDREQTFQLLRSFYELLLADVLQLPEVRSKVASMGDNPTLVITAHGSLAQLPFAALHDGERYLVEQYNVIQASPLFPAGNFKGGVIDYESLVGGAPNSMSSLRVLAGGENLHQIPYEIGDLRKLAERCRFGMEVGATSGWTMDTLRWLFDGPGMALLSAHMQASAADPTGAVVITPDGRELAIGSALDGHVKAKIVLLSSCLSAGFTDWLSPGENSVVNLLRTAGAETVISTLWPIEDYPARLYNVALVEGLAEGKSRALAHGCAQRLVMQSSAAGGISSATERLARKAEGGELKPDAQFIKRLDHPSYWGGFVLSGAWR